MANGAGIPRLVGTLANSATSATHTRAQAGPCRARGHRLSPPEIHVFMGFVVYVIKRRNQL